jgi:hypothetical protein
MNPPELWHRKRLPPNAALTGHPFTTRSVTGVEAQVLEFFREEGRGAPKLKHKRSLLYFRSSPKI